jgi:hypothetical protein
VHVATWAFVLEELGPEQTRLIVRVRANTGYSFRGLPLGLVKVIHYIMQRKQLLEIARRAELRSDIQGEGSLKSPPSLRHIRGEQRDNSKTTATIA